MIQFAHVERFSVSLFVIQKQHFRVYLPLCLPHNVSWQGPAASLYLLPAVFPVESGTYSQAMVTSEQLFKSPKVDFFTLTFSMELVEWARMGNWVWDWKVTGFVYNLICLLFMEGHFHFSIIKKIHLTCIIRCQVWKPGLEIWRGGIHSSSVCVRRKCQFTIVLE